MSSQEIYFELHTKISALRQTQNRTAFLTGTSYFIAITLATLFFASCFEMLFEMDTLTRQVLDGFIVILLTATFVFESLRPFLRWLGILNSTDEAQLARHIGSQFPSIKDRLANAIELHKNKPEGASESLIQAALATIREHTKSLNFTSILDTTDLRRAQKILLATTIVIGLSYIFLRENLSDAFARLLNPHRISIHAIPFDWKLTPGNATLLQGDNLLIDISLTPKENAVTPDRLSLFWQVENAEHWTEEILRRDSAGTFHMELKNIRQSLRYYGQISYRSTGRTQSGRSEEYAITTLKRPSVKRLQIAITPPLYSRISARELDENVGDITSLAGSQIKVQIEATKALRSAKLLFSDSSSSPLTIGNFQKSKAEGVWTLRQSHAYVIHLTDIDGVESKNPVEYQAVTLPDEFPFIQMIAPSGDVDINESMLLRLLADAQDDYGFTRLALRYRLEKTKGFAPIRDEFSTIDLSFLLAPASQQSLAYTWDFSKMLLQPEDVVSFYLDISDNDGVRGPKIAKSEIRRMRFPSIEEIFSKADASHKESLEKAEDIVKQSEEMKKALEEIHNDLLKDKKMDWKEKEKIKELTEKQEKIQKAVEDIKKNIEETVQNLKENKLLSKETLEKYQELQKLLQEINNPEMQKMMQQLNSSMKNAMNPDQMKDAMKKFKMDEASFKQSMERTVELLKRIKIEQTFDQMRKQSEDIAHRQDQVNENSKTQNDPEKNQKLADEQKQIEKSLNRLNQTGENLKKDVQKLDKNMRTEKLDEANKQMRSGSMQQSMEKSAAAMKENSPSKESQEEQKKASRELDSLKKTIQQAQKEFQKQQDQQIQTAMRKAIFDLIEISKNQESALTETKSLIYASPNFRETAQDQADVLTTMNGVTENIMELSNKTFFINSVLGKIIGQALGAMATAVQQLEDRNSPAAAQYQTQAMTAVNDAVKHLLSSMKKMDEGASSSGMSQMMEEMQKMAAQQGQVNQGTQAAMPGGQNPGEMGEEQMAQMGRMLAEQQAIRQGLEGMQSQAGENQNMKNQLGKMAQDMDEVIKDMQANNVNRKTIERQQKIFQRMLDAAKSTQEKDFSEKRESQKGGNYEMKSPRELPTDITERKAKLRQELLRELQQGYTKDYQDLIRKYFDALGNANLDNGKN